MKSKAELLEALDHCRYCRTVRPHDGAMNCSTCSYSAAPSTNMTRVCRDLLDDVHKYITNFDGKDMIFGIPEGHVKSALDSYNNREIHLSILHEEMGELMQSLSKYKRAVEDRAVDEAKAARDSIAEETVHVVICCAMLTKLFDITQAEIDAEIKRKNDALLDRKETIEQGGSYNIVWDFPIGSNAVGERTNMTIKEVRKSPSSKGKVYRMSNVLVKSIELSVFRGDAKTRIVIEYRGKVYNFESVPDSPSEYTLASIKADL